jgi:putative flippase GtrA
LYDVDVPIEIAAPVAFIAAAGLNYLLSIAFIFRHKAKWGSIFEIIAYCVVVLAGALLDLMVTQLLISFGNTPRMAKGLATLMILAFNFLGRRYFVFPLAARGGWKERNQKL